MKRFNGIDYLDTHDFAERAGVTPECCWQWANRGAIPSFRLAGQRKLWFRTEDVEAFLTMSPVKVAPAQLSKQSKRESTRSVALASKRVAAWSARRG